MADISRFAFLVYPRNNSMTFIDDEINDLLESLKCIGWITFVSPVHHGTSAYDDFDIENHIKSEPTFKEHVHVLVDVQTRLQRPSILKTLHSVGVYPAQDFLLVRNDHYSYYYYALYLTHQTPKSRYKEQFEVDPYILNCVEAVYYELIRADPYILCVLHIIDTLHPSSARDFYRLCLADDDCSFYADRIFQDLHKWVNFLDIPKQED